MASDLLSVGTQSVLTAQKQLNTTSHNIANANTDGFNRQSVIQEANTPRLYGGQSYGMGVHVENVRRSWDQFAVNELNLSTTDLHRNQAVETNYEILSGLLASNASKKVPENMNAFFDAVKSLSDSPNDMGSRKVVLEQAKVIAKNLNNFHETVRVESANSNKRLDATIDRINGIALEIRDVHRAMMKTNGPKNDLLDQHDKLIKELSQFTKVTVTPKSGNEAFNVHIGNGHSIVSGVDASQLALVNGDPDPQQRQLAIIEGKGIKRISPKDIDGELGALLDMRDKHIPQVSDELGRLALAFSHSINTLQESGLDLNGQVGQHMFNDINHPDSMKARVVQNPQSSAQMAVKITDLSQLSGGEYKLQFDGTKYTVTDDLDNQQILYPASDGSISFDGVKVDIQAPPQVGERILIRPTRTGAQDIQVAMRDAASIAAQSYDTSHSFTTGKGEVEINSVGTLKEFQVVVSPTGTQFAVTDMNGNVLLPPQAYPPGASISLQGTSFSLTDGAHANDTFAFNLNHAEGDNGNLRKIQSLQTDKLMNDGNSSVIQLYHNLNTDVGLQHATSSRATQVSRLENEAAQSRIASISGVNLDEEAANMMKFQQAYMASSKVMQAANDTFNTILQLR
jgi:flagellar hook-associated protein 1 FlgK